MAIQVLNTSSQIEGKTIATLEEDEEFTGTKSFSQNVTMDANLSVGGDLIVTDDLSADVATLNGVKFPATQVASADANTLDDYEEGTWTPAITFLTSAGTPTYTTQSGTYVKIGKMVHIMGRLTLSSKGGGTGIVTISGLPFTVGTNHGGAHFPFFANFAAAMSWSGGYAEGSTTRIVVQGIVAAGSASTTTMTNTSINDNWDIVIVGSYIASA